LIKKIKAAGTETKRKGRPKGVKPDSAAGYPSWIDTSEGAEAIKRIIEATDEKPDDEERLALEIGQAYSLFKIDLYIDEAKTQQRRKLPRRVIVDLERIIKRISGDSLSEWLEPELLRLVTHIRSLINWQPDHGERIARALNLYLYKTNAPDEKAGSRPAMRQPRPRNPSPLELLAVSLVGVYARRFNSEVEFGPGDDDEPRGAVIRFVKATMAELGLSQYKPGSIARAVTNWRSWASSEKS
jgi:hypothetical protein